LEQDSQKPKVIDLYKHHCLPNNGKENYK